jgi:hypothetical protein
MAHVELYGFRSATCLCVDAIIWLATVQEHLPANYHTFACITARTHTQHT